MTREFNFTYQVPPADCIAGFDVKIECECKGFMHEGEPVVIVLNSKLVGLGWADLWSANATANKLTEAAKQHFVNWVSNAEQMENSEGIVNEILNVKNN